ncbi:34655_t:CDS:2, partial [Gigaspora margarita]
MDNNTSNNSSNNNLPPNNIVCSHELSHNTYDSDSSDSSIRTTRSLQEIFIRISGKRGRIQSKQAAQPSSSRNESHTCYTSYSIECLHSRSHSPLCGQQSSNQNQPRENYVQEEPNNQQQIDNYRCHTNFESNGPHYESAKSIMNNDLLVQSHNTEQSKEDLPETGLSRNSLAILTQEENDDLFGVNE